ncbi:hypothetical protein WR25_08142 isoform B [Diploscapter pachys]|nr:hypothetical protein WR25_08142 isoform B [Diploscapter pachys]
MTDIADVSVEQAKGRYEEMKDRNRRNFFFPAEFIVADSTKDDLMEKYANKMPFDISSCQFSLHYSFCDEQSARTYIRNAVGNLKPGGFFIGTLPDANRIVWAARQGNGMFKNAVCSITFENTEQLLNEQLPHFGAKFHFTLDEQVNCPEFLAHFSLLQKILVDEFDMDLVFVRQFPDAAKKWMASREGRELASKMRALEKYPPFPGQNPSGEADEYGYAEEQLKKMNEDGNKQKYIECLSKSEWEAVCMYLVFAFRKRKPEPEKKPEEEVKEAEEDRKRKCPAEDEAAGDEVLEKRQKTEEEESGQEQGKDNGEQGGAE